MPPELEQQSTTTAEDDGINKPVVAEPEAVEMIDDTEIHVTLITPLQRSDGQTIKVVTVREPSAAMIHKAGGRTSLMMMQDGAFAKLMPRITTPQLTPQMYMGMRVKDSQKLINAVLTFLTDTSTIDGLDEV